MASLMGPGGTASAAYLCSGLLTGALLGPSGLASAASVFSVLLAAALVGHGAAAGPAVNFSALTLPSDFLYSRSGMNSLLSCVSYILFLINRFTLKKR